MTAALRVPCRGTGGPLRVACRRDRDRPAAVAQERDPRAAARSRAALRSGTRCSPSTTTSSSRPGCSKAGCRARLQELAPKVVETEEGHEVWEFDGQVFFQVGLNAVVGRKREDWKVEPTRFDEMRPGCYDVDARVRDMDINGVWASVNFPSQITGFCGSVFSRCADPELGLAVTQAWNDWFFDEWYSPHPERIVPMGITYLADAEQGARGDPAQRRRVASPR